jgi:cytochrome c oxidase assembly protein subunit 11
MRKMSRNDRVLAMCIGMLCAMLSLTYASVPLYRMFCQVTGFDGTPMRAEALSSATSSQVMEIRFDANTGQGLPWEFRPETNSMKVHLGENGFTNFVAHNESSEEIVGTATFNVTPLLAAKYFNKTQCFCFERQPLKPGEKTKLGVAFYVDPAIATDPETKHLKAITLSYTFFPAKGDTTDVAALKTP